MAPPAAPPMQQPQQPYATNTYNTDPVGIPGIGGVRSG